MIVTLLSASALLLYLGASGTLVASFAGGRGVEGRTGAALMGTGFLLHAAALAAFTATYSELPLVGLAPSLCTLAFLIALFHITSTVSNDSRPVGLVLVPLVALLLAVALALGIAPAGQPLAFRGLWFNVHVLLAFLGYAGLATSFAAGLLYLLQFRELKGKRLGRVFRFFPSLPALDLLGRRGLIAGFPALTLALLLGWAWTMRFQQGFAITNPQVIWGVFTWVIFAVVIGFRLARTPNSERRAAQASVIGFVLVVAAYFVLRLLMAGGRVFL